MSEIKTNYTTFATTVGENSANMDSAFVEIHSKGVGPWRRRTLEVGGNKVYSAKAKEFDQTMVDIRVAGTSAIGTIAGMAMVAGVKSVTRKVAQKGGIKGMIPFKGRFAAKPPVKNFESYEEVDEDEEF